VQPTDIGAFGPLRTSSDASANGHLVDALPKATGGGRSWWAHRESTRATIELTILQEKVEEKPVASVTSPIAAASACPRDEHAPSEASQSGRPLGVERGGARTTRQSGVGRSMRSTTNTSTGPRVASSRSPSCSRSDVRSAAPFGSFITPPVRSISVPPTTMRSGASGGGSWSGVQVRSISKRPVSPVRSTTRRLAWPDRKLANSSSGRAS